MEREKGQMKSGRDIILMQTKTSRGIFIDSTSINAESLNYIHICRSINPKNGPALLASRSVEKKVVGHKSLKTVSLNSVELHDVQNMQLCDLGYIL